MTYLDTATDRPPSDEDRTASGFVPNFARTFARRPQVYEAWKALNAAVKANMDLRRYELATVAAAVALRSSYCTLAHGRTLATEFLTEQAVIDVVRNPDATGLDPTDQAIITFARAVALHADRIDAADIAGLRAHGLTDDEIFDVALAAAARCFFSKSLDATGTAPDAVYSELPPALRDALTVGRPIESGAPATGD